MHLRFQANTRHTERFFNALLLVDQKFLRQDVQHFLIRWNSHRLSGIDHALQILGVHLTIFNRHDAVRVHAANVAARNARIHRMNLATRHQLCLIDRATNGLHSGLNVHHHSLFEAVGAMRANAHNFEHAFR